MSKLITLCRDIEPTSTDCMEDHDGSDVSLAAPCRVELVPCDMPSEFVGPEAESSAIFQTMTDIKNC